MDCVVLVLHLHSLSHVAPLSSSDVSRGVSGPFNPRGSPRREDLLNSYGVSLSLEIDGLSFKIEFSSVNR